MWKIIAPVLLIGALSGCSIGAQAITDLGDLQQDVREFVSERFEERRRIRRECAELRDRQVEALRNEGKFEEAALILDASYPPLITQQAIAAIVEGDREALAVIDVSGCAVDLGEPVASGLPE